MIPESTKFQYPVLQLLADGKEHSSNEIKAYVINKFSISDDEKLILTSNEGRNQPRYLSHTNFAIQDLKKAGFLMRAVSKKGYTITAAGSDFFANHQDGFVAKDLRSSEAYRKYKQPKGKKPDTNSKEKQDNNAPASEGNKSSSGESALGLIRELIENEQRTFDERLLNAVKSISPKAFEVLIRNLLVKMKVASSDECIELTQYSKDGGVDIIIWRNTLKNQVDTCIQVKQYNNNVDYDTATKLGGTLLNNECHKGIIITTSSFTKGAINYNPPGCKITRIDGLQLVKLLKEYQLGVSSVKFDFLAIDEDYLKMLE